MQGLGYRQTWWLKDDSSTTGKGAVTPASYLRIPGSPLCLTPNSRVSGRERRKTADYLGKRRKTITLQTPDGAFIRKNSKRENLSEHPHAADFLKTGKFPDLAAATTLGVERRVKFADEDSC